VFLLCAEGLIEMEKKPDREKDIADIALILSQYRRREENV